MPQPSSQPSESPSPTSGGKTCGLPTLPSTLEPPCLTSHSQRFIFLNFSPTSLEIYFQVCNVLVMYSICGYISTVVRGEGETLTGKNESQHRPFSDDFQDTGEWQMPFQGEMGQISWAWNNTTLVYFIQAKVRCIHLFQIQKAI